MLALENVLTTARSRRQDKKHTRPRRRCSFRVQQSRGAARRRRMCPSSLRQCRRSERFRACFQAHPPRPPERGRRQQRLGRPPWEWEASFLCAEAIRSGRRVRSSRSHRERRREKSTLGLPVKLCAAARAVKRVWNALKRGHSGSGSRLSRSCLILWSCVLDVEEPEVLLARQCVFVVVTRLQGRRGGLRFAQRMPWWGEGGSKGGVEFVLSLQLVVYHLLNHSSHLPLWLAPAWSLLEGCPYNPAPLGRHRR